MAVVSFPCALPAEGIRSPSGTIVSRQSACCCASAGDRTSMGNEPTKSCTTSPAVHTSRASSNQSYCNARRACTTTVILHDEILLRPFLRIDKAQTMHDAIVTCLQSNLVAHERSESEVAHGLHSFPTSADRAL